MNITAININDIQVNFEPVSMKVVPEVDGNQNVVGKIIWAATFSFQGHEVVGGGSTDLMLYGINNFVPVDQLTKQDLVNFIIEANGGQNWVDRLKDIHLEFLWQKVLDSQMIDYPLPQN